MEASRLVFWPISLALRHPSLIAFSGMHKHFRMIAISENLRNHGYTAAKDDHTRIPGIWEKLKGLYNLEALDERVCL